MPCKWEERPNSLQYEEDPPTSIYATVAGTAWAGNESLVTGGMRAEEQKVWRGVRIKCIIVSSFVLCSWDCFFSLACPYDLSRSDSLVYFIIFIFFKANGMCEFPLEQGSFSSLWGTISFRWCLFCVSVNYTSYYPFKTFKPVQTPVF